MKKVIKISSNDLNNIIVESVKHILNELDARTYFNAGDKAFKLGQNHRGYDLYDHGTKMLNLDINQDGYNVKFNYNGFSYPEQHLYYELEHDDLSIYNSGDGFVSLEPGDPKMRIKDRRVIKIILQYFAKYKPDSKYNNKNYWIA